jgi:ABC-2 type transport system ATP-binding protein
MQQLREHGCGVLVSSHNLHELERLADRVAILRTQLIAVDSMSALRARAPGRRLRIGLRSNVAGYAAALGTTTGLDVRADATSLSIELDARRPESGHDSDIPSLVRRLVEQGADVEFVRVEEASLEEVYLQLLNTPTGIVS